MLGAICNAGHTNSETGLSGGTVSSSASSASRWTVSFGYRWQDSYRHFRGDVEQTERLEQQTQMENKLHLFDASVSYRVSPRWSMSVGAPFMKVDRINHRTGGVTHSVGLGDMSIGARMWIFRPPNETPQNIQIGFGIKLPTGRPDVTNRTATGNITTVDQSIQLGDSGTGFSLDYLAFKSIQRFTIFSTGSYLFNPRNTYTAPTPGSRQLSVPDQYLWRSGVGYAVPKLVGLAFTFGGRMEGVPARDKIGREDGFRRPGYAVSIDPGVMFARGRDTWSVSVPIAVHRDRTRSVPDTRSGGHGDAAFADSLIVVGYSRNF